ncbi:MAG: flagellar basal body L-ring protein FlgH [Bdellovibrionales bacterium]|nr:flagellar basal body L-ring protein FlgH [Bdellovibrionales bacterium]
MRRDSLLWALGVTLALMGLSGCAQLMGSLRRDLDDRAPYKEPTVGGVFTEGNVLGGYEFESPSGADMDLEYRAVGHSERSPASARSSAGPQARSGPVPPSYADTPNLPPETKRLYQDPARARKEDFEDNSPNEGSLWASTGQTNYFFTKNKVKSVGDLVTVVIKERLVKDIAFEVKKTLTQEEAEAALAEADARKLAEFEKSGRAPAAKKPGEEVQVADGDVPDEPEKPEITPTQFSELDITENVGVKDGEQMMAEILERYPNGNYKIRATKRVPYRSENRMVTVVAIARGNDINEAETVDAGNLYEYRIKAYR